LLKNSNHQIPIWWFFYAQPKRGFGMKKLISTFLVFICFSTANAAPGILIAYDSNIYFECCEPFAIGDTTAYSDMYYYYDIKNKTMTITQTEWKRGAGGLDYPESNDAVFNYNDITIDNMRASIPNYIMLDFIYDDLRAQFGALVSESVIGQYKASVVSMHTKNLFYVNANQLDTRFDRTGKGLSAWATQSYNYQWHGGAYGFSGDTMGLSFGADKWIGDNIMLGVGYTFNDSEMGGIESIGHNLYLYGSYKFSRHYINAILNYGFAKYTERNTYGVEWSYNPLTINSKYDVANYGLAAYTGYEMPNGILPEVGLRYLYISPDSYTDSIGGEIKPESNNTLTLVSGAKYALDISTISLKMKLHIVYDVVSQDEIIRANVYGYEQRVVADGLSPFGIESGLALETFFDRFNISLGYDFIIRGNYQSHTGIIRARYSF
jgi:hypothetical protein